jgi:hypothetical protein
MNSKFTPIPHKYLHKLLTSKFTAKEIKVVLLLCRIIFGCHRKDKTAVINKCQFELALIGGNHIKEVIESLIEKRVIVYEEANNSFRFCPKWWRLKCSKEAKIKLNEIIHNSIENTGSQNGRKKVPKLGNDPFPKQEEETSQNGNMGENNSPNQSSFLNPKDSIKDNTKNTDKDKNIAVDKSFKKTNTKLDEVHYHADQLLNRIEPKHPESYNFYLWSVWRAGPNILYQFASEIEQDKSISVADRGKVFNKKVQDHLNRVEKRSRLI